MTEPEYKDLDRSFNTSFEWGSCFWASHSTS